MVLHNKYGRSTLNAYSGGITNLSDSGTDVVVALLDGNHSFDETHDSWADISTNEIADADYSPQSLSNMSLSHDGAGVVTFDADDVSFGTDVTISADHAVVYDNTPSTDADKKLLTHIDFEGTEQSENGEFSITWGANGIFTVDTS